MLFAWGRVQCRLACCVAQVDNGVTCDNCMALVETAPYGNRCDRYCESFGHVCIEAAEEMDENCQVKYKKPCDQPIESTSDMLCKCVKENAPPFCPVPPPPTPEPTPSPDARIQVVGDQAKMVRFHDSFLLLSGLMMS